MALTRGAANYATHGFIPTHFSKKLKVKLDKTCVALDCVNRDWESEFASGGDIARVREFQDVTVKDYTIDNNITYDTVGEAYTDIVIDQQKYFAFKLDLIDETQADIDVMDGYAERAAIGLRDTIDTHLLSGMSAAVPAGNTLGATILGSTIQLTADNIYDVFVDLFTLLEESNIFGATDQMPWAIIPPRVHGLMKKSSQFTQATDMGDQLIRNGVLGEFAGFEIKKTTNSPLVAATGNNDDHFNILAGVNMAYTFAMQVDEVEDLRLQTTFAEAMRGLAVYGSKVINATGLTKLVAKV